MVGHDASSRSDWLCCRSGRVWLYWRGLGVARRCVALGGVGGRGSRGGASAEGVEGVQRAAGEGKVGIEVDPYHPLHRALGDRLHTHTHTHTERET